MTINKTRLETEFAAYIAETMDMKSLVSFATENLARSYEIMELELLIETVKYYAPHLLEQDDDV